MAGIDGPAPRHRQSRALGDRPRRLVPRVLDAAPCPRPRAADRARRPACGIRATSPHATRWQLDLPDRAGTFGYMADVLARQEERLGGTVDDDARYFYELAIRHEDMHVEALTYSRQTLAYAPPHGLGDARRSGGGRACRATSTCRAGRGAWDRPRRTASSSTTRSGRTRRPGAVPHRPRAGHQRRVRGLRRGRRLSRAGILERCRLGVAAARAMPSVRSTG